MVSLSFPFWKSYWLKMSLEKKKQNHRTGWKTDSSLFNSNSENKASLISSKPSSALHPEDPQCCSLPWRVGRASEVMNTGKTRVLRQSRYYASCSKERFRVHTDTTILVTQDINHSLCRNTTYMRGKKIPECSVAWAPGKDFSLNGVWLSLSSDTGYGQIPVNSLTV